MNNNYISISYIYTLSDPISLQVKYIGKSDMPLVRYQEHLKKCKYSTTIKNNWIKKLLGGGQKPLLEILDVVLTSEWSFWEKFWISQFRGWGFKLYNMTDGGDGGNFGFESNLKISSKLKNRVFSSETIKLMSESAKKRKLTETGRKNLSQKRMGSKNPMFGKKQSLYCIKSKMKLVTQFTVSGEFVREWESLKSVSESLSINRNSIRMVCNGQRKSAGGYKWLFS
jgi:hypothetical protein